MKAVEIPVTAQWEAVRHRIHRIQMDMERIALEITSNEDAVTGDVVRRLEGLQEKFERIMGQLAAFDDEGQEVVRNAKEEFRRIVGRYQLSRKAGRLGLH